MKNLKRVVKKASLLGSIILMSGGFIQNTNAVIFDGDVDSANLGKGD